MNHTDSNGLASRVGEQSLPAVIAGSEPLRGKRERFAQLLRLGLPCADSYREAGYPDDALSFADNARKLANRKTVKERVAYLRGNYDQAVWEEKRKLLEERQWLWHEADIGDFYEMTTEPWCDPKGNPVLDVAGNPIMRERERLKPLSTLPRELRLCVESLTYTDSGKPNLKLYNKGDANRELRKINGIDAVPSIADGDPAMKLSDGQFFKELLREAQELGVDLKMTFEAFGADAWNDNAGAT